MQATKQEQKASCENVTLEEFLEEHAPKVGKKRATHVYWVLQRLGAAIAQAMPTR